MVVPCYPPPGSFSAPVEERRRAEMQKEFWMDFRSTRGPLDHRARSACAKAHPAALSGSGNRLIIERRSVCAEAHPTEATPVFSNRLPARTTWRTATLALAF